MAPDLTDDGARGVLPTRDTSGLGIALLSQHVETQHSEKLVISGRFGYLLEDRVFAGDDSIEALCQVARGWLRRRIARDGLNVADPSNAASVRGPPHPCVEAAEALTGDGATSMVSRADTCENLEARMPAVDHERTIRDYFDACTAGDAQAIASFFAPDAVHYFPDGDTYPDGSPQRAFRGADAIGHGFGDRFGGEFRTRWTVDHVIVDAERREAVIEWSNFKPSVSPDARLRGAEFYRFDAAGKIVEIRAYYACPPGGPERPYELGEFDYAARGYPVADR